MALPAAWVCIYIHCIMYHSVDMTELNQPSLCVLVLLGGGHRGEQTRLKCLVGRGTSQASSSTTPKYASYSMRIVSSLWLIHHHTTQQRAQGQKKVPSLFIYIRTWCLVPGSCFAGKYCEHSSSRRTTLLLWLVSFSLKSSKRMLYTWCCSQYIFASSPRLVAVVA